MTSISIQGRVDSEVWAELKRANETNTKLLQRLISNYQATSGNELNSLAATPQGAIAVLLHSHSQLEKLLSKAALVLPSTTITLPSQPTSTEAICYDNEY